MPQAQPVMDGVSPGFYPSPTVDSGVVDHPQFGRVNYRVTHLPVEADPQAMDTIGVMSRKVREDSRNPQFQSWVLRQFSPRTYVGVNGVSSVARSESELVDAVHHKVRNSIQFQRDEITGAGVGGYPESEVVEVISRPLDMVGYIEGGNAFGDCDDFAMMVGACLTVLGIESKFVLISADARSPLQYSHVYVAAYPVVSSDGRKERIAVDASHGQYCGWEAPNLGRVTEIPVTGGGLMGWVFTAGIVGMAAYGLYESFKLGR